MGLFFGPLGKTFLESWFPDFQTPPPKKLSDPNPTPLPTHPGIKYVARALAATYLATKGGLQQGLPIGPPRNMGNVIIFCISSAHAQIPKNLTKRGKGCFPTNQDPANVLGVTDYHSDKLNFLTCLHSIFPDFRRRRTNSRKPI